MHKQKIPRKIHLSKISLEFFVYLSVAKKYAHIKKIPKRGYPYAEI